MSRAKVFISISMVLVLIALSGASVWAAPTGQEESTPITGEVQEVVIEFEGEFDAETATVLVTVDESGEIQTVRLSWQTAFDKGLVGLDPDGNPIVPEGAVGSTVNIDPSEVIEEGETAQHPVASALAEFFADTLGLDYDTVMGYHEDGMGFGVIAQACWMSYGLEGDASLVGDILEAKKSHDFSSITLPNGETPTNWGQFRKAVMGSDKAKKNLGAIMSGRAGDELTTTANEDQKGKKDKGSGVEPPGKDKGGPPAVPPGQEKDKDNKGGGKGKGKDKG